MRKAGKNRVAAITIMVFAVGLLFLEGRASAEPEFNYHGQFRINSYTDTKSGTSDFGDESNAASRLRWRPTFDVTVSDTVSMHTQFNIGHIREGFGNHNLAHNGDPSFGLRHALIKAQVSDGITGVAGIVPVSDKFGDTLFSGDWDFNPITLALFITPSEGMVIRAGAAKLVEGNEQETEKDDIDAYVLDIDKGPFGFSVYHITSEKDASFTVPGTSVSGADATMTYYGVRYSNEYDSGMKVNAFLMGSAVDLKAADIKASGIAAKAEIKMPVNDMTVGALVIYASGDEDFGKSGTTANSFITPMSAIGHHGYWGYTGKLNIQGPTDTGIDDPVNIDGGSYGNANLGHGLTTVQANLSMPVSDKVSAYFAIGWFQSNAAASGVSKDIGTDIYAQGKWNIGESLNLEFGVDHASLGEGSHMSVASDGTRKSRTVTTVFSRLQLEY